MFDSVPLNVIALSAIPSPFEKVSPVIPLSVITPFAADREMLRVVASMSSTENPAIVRSVSSKAN